MREIKFRGKRLRDGKWVYGFFRIDDYNLIIAIDGNFIVEYKVNPETVGQFTGLHDKNGKEIFEGDIVEFLDTGEEGYEYKEGYDFNNIASIVWKNGRFELDKIYDNNSTVLEFMNNESHEEFIDELMHDCEIIGNIHDNPQLAKKEQIMQVTGTNEIQDLWANLQAIKHIITKPISDTSKKRLINKYDEYKKCGGKQIDEQIENWRKEIK